MDLTLLENYIVRTGKDRLYYNTLNESEKKILSRNMVNKLFKSIKSKSLKVDYFGLEKTKGDITKFKKYSDIENSIAILHRMYNADPTNSPSEILTLVKTLESLKKNKNDFVRCFAEKNEVVIMLYTNIAATLIAATANIILTTIHYIKTPLGDFKKIFKDENEQKFKSKVYFNSLNKYLKIDQNGDLKLVMNKSIKINESFDFNDSNGYLTEVVFIPLAIIAVIFVICIFIREIVFLFYYERKKISNDLLALAYFIEEHAYEIDTSKSEHNKQVFRNQLNAAKKLKDLAEFIAVKTDDAEKKSFEEIKKEDDENAKESQQNNNETSSDENDDSDGEIIL